MLPRNTSLAPATLVMRPATRPPVAVLSVGERRSGFYPLADFSPEWVALRWGSTQGAEVAFVTRETKRRLGMARILSDRLRSEAKKRGLASLHAQVAPENEAMLGLFQSYPHKLSRIAGTTAVAVDMPL